MSNHPNRGPKGLCSNPAPAEIVELRKGFGFTQSFCASLVFNTLRNWQQWEAGDRRMHPAFMELFKIKATAFKLAESDKLPA